MFHKSIVNKINNLSSIINTRISNRINNKYITCIKKYDIFGNSKVNVNDENILELDLLNLENSNDRARKLTQISCEYSLYYIDLINYMSTCDLLTKNSLFLKIDDILSISKLLLCFNANKTEDFLKSKLHNTGIVKENNSDNYYWLSFYNNTSMFFIPLNEDKNIKLNDIILSTSTSLCPYDMIYFINLIKRLIKTANSSLGPTIERLVNIEKSKISCIESALYMNIDGNNRIINKPFTEI